MNNGNPLMVMFTGNPRIDARLAMDKACSDYEIVVNSKFLVGNDVIENYSNYVKLENGKLNFKVVKCSSYKTSFQVNFTDGKWILYKIENGKAVVKCGTAA